MKCKKIASIVLAGVMMLSLCSNVTVAEAATKKKTALSSKSVTMKVGQKKTIKLKNYKKISKKNVKKVKWSTSNKKVAVVKYNGKYRQEGKVTAKGKGSTYVKVKYDGKTYKCKVTVKEDNKSTTENKSTERVTTEKTTTEKVTTEKATTEKTTEKATSEEQDKPSDKPEKPTEHVHTWGDWGVTTQATCDTNGEEARECTVCKQQETREIGAKGHKWGEGAVIKEASYTAPGEKLYTCSVCSKTKTESIPMLNEGEHEWNDGTITTQPTCISTGTKEYTCKKCGGTKTEEVPALGHKEVYAGTEGIHSKCSVCNVVIKDGSKHQYQDTTLDGDCLHKTKVKHTCECGYSYTTESGNYVHEDAVNGGTKDAHKVCSNCGAVIEDGTHHNAVKVSTTATCENNGEATFKCECGYTYAEAEPALGHDYDEDGICKNCCSSVNVENAEIYDVSEAGDKSVVMYTVPVINDDTTTYDCYVKTMKEGGVLHSSTEELLFDVVDKTSISKILFLNSVTAPEDSSHLFGGRVVNYRYVNGKRREYYTYPDKLSKIVNLKYLNTANTTSMYGMFEHCTTLTSLDVSNFNTSNTTSMAGMFDWCSSLTTLKLDNFDTSKVSNMNNMFSFCESISSLNLSNFNTSKATGMSFMFNGCSELKELNISNFITTNVVSMHGMFSGCTSLLELNVKNFDTSNVEYVDYMFSSCSSLTSLDVSNFNTSNVKGMSCMFYGCKKLTELNVRNFNTSNVTRIDNMFMYCESLKELNLSSFNTSNVKEMGGMFAHCTSLKELELSSFDTSKVETMSEMFWDTPVLSKIYVSSSKWIISSECVTTNMFTDCGCSDVTYR